MKNIKKLSMVAALVLIAAVTALLGACGITMEERKKQEGYIHTVTYDANGGDFGSNITRTYALVKDNSLTAAPGYKDKNQAEVKIPMRTDFELVGETSGNVFATKSWYLAETDENGNVVYEGEGEKRTAKLASDTPWDFLKDRVTKDITLVAVWQKVFKFVILAYDTDEVIRSFTVDEGDTIADKLYEKQDDEFVRSPEYIDLNAGKRTVLDFYLDKEMTELLPFDFVHPGKNPETGDNNVPIYAKYLEGKYDFIKQDNLKTLAANSNWYLVEDVDYSNVKTDWGMINGFSGNIYGNGHTISGISVKTTATRATGGYNSYSIFGKISGVIENVSFKNVTFTVSGDRFVEKIDGDQKIAFFATELVEGGRVENVSIKDCSVKVEYASTLDYSISPDSGNVWIIKPDTSGVTIYVGDDVADEITVIVQ